MHNPTIGKWFDEKEGIVDANLYRFNKNSPTNLVDPSGLTPAILGVANETMVGFPRASSSDLLSMQVGAVTHSTVSEGQIAGNVLAGIPWNPANLIGQLPPGFPAINVIYRVIDNTKNLRPAFKKEVMAHIEETNLAGCSFRAHWPNQLLEEGNLTSTVAANTAQAELVLRLFGHTNVETSEPLVVISYGVNNWQQPTRLGDVDGRIVVLVSITSRDSTGVQRTTLLRNAAQQGLGFRHATLRNRTFGGVRPWTDNP